MVLPGFVGQRERAVCKFYLVAACVMLSFAAACSRSAPNFIAVDPMKRSDTWALERADIDCKAEAGSPRWRLRYRADPKYVACMQQKGFIEAQT
jgi:hypothetical protein